MKIICSKNDLLNSVNIVLKAVSAKTTMPILDCILIKVNSEGIKLIGNDMELGIETFVRGRVLEEGMIAINAKIFSDIIRKLPDNDVSIETDDTLNAKISCEKAKFNIIGMMGEEFPALPVIEKNNNIRISQFTLKELIRQTVFSISLNENNKIMSGELFEIKENKFRVASLDGNRISIRVVELKDNYGDYQVIVPGKTLNEISKILSGELSDEMNMYITDKHIMFELEDTVILSRLIEGKYYNINQMLSGDYETKITINKREMLSCIDRATLLIKESEKKPVIMNVLSDTLEFKMNTSIGSLNEDVSISNEGKDILIAFNPKFLIDALRVIDDEDITIYMINPKAPCFIKNKEESYIYLILPVNFNQG